MILQFFSAFFMNGHLNQCQHTDNKKIINLNFELDLDFPWKACIDRLPCQFSRFWAPLQQNCTWFKILSATAVKLHLRKSAVLLQWRSNFWKLAWEPVEKGVWRCFWGQCEISVSKMGFTVQKNWNKHRNIPKAEKYQKNGSLKNEQCLFLCAVLDMNPSMVGKS